MFLAVGMNEFLLVFFLVWGTLYQRPDGWRWKDLCRGIGGILFDEVSLPFDCLGMEFGWMCLAYTSYFSCLVDDLGKL